jgi:preprotein translocase SecE subunit
MAVAVKNAAEVASQSPFERHRLAVSSLVGALYVLGSIGLIFYGVPALWWRVLFPGDGAASFVLVALHLVVMLGGMAGLTYVGLRLVGKPEKGLRAGILVGSLTLLAVAYTTWLIAKILEATFFGDESRWTAGIIVTLIIGAGLLFLAVRTLLRPGFEDVAQMLEEQGWVSLEGYKRSQGQRVRRGTMLGILIVAGCGIYTLLAHQTLESAGRDWVWFVPFSDQQFTLLGDVRFTVPLLLAAVSGWFAYRVVNFPVFADFLIATEAEINKVSWTTRKRLVQDTIVVMVTVILFTLFLFIVDQAWGRLLAGVGVIKIDTTQQDQGQREDAQPW